MQQLETTFSVFLVISVKEICILCLGSSPFLVCLACNCYHFLSIHELYQLSIWEAELKALHEATKVSIEMSDIRILNHDSAFGKNYEGDNNNETARTGASDH